MMRVSLRTGRLPVRLAIGLAVALGCLAALPAQHAGANPPGPHDPTGAVESVAATATGGIQFTGWAYDPDEPAANLLVRVLIDGQTWTTSAPTSIARPDIVLKHATGPTPGFTIASPVDPAVPHTACVVATNLDSGLDTVLRCVVTPLGTKLSPTQLAAHSAQGHIAWAVAHPASLHFHGWATDPDYVARPATVVLYVDGAPAATVNTVSYPQPRPVGAGPRSLWDISVPVDAGTHVGCVWLVNIGLGSNTFLGCRTKDTRGPAGSGTITVPPLNKKVVAEAQTHLGQPYVWGATGPRKFDCSGLVMYSYAKFGYATPRISEDQRTAARLIPASRAVPGDLVFYNDQVGDVYHVGIYLSPGKTVAAVDPAEGVTYQNIWDPSSTTYGSFTHT